MGTTEAKIDEIFSSFQGEGIYVGKRHLFFRFHHCNLTCQYCDTPQSLNGGEFCKIEKSTGSNEFEKANNPISLNEAINYFNKFEPVLKLHHALSLTGGEPLLQVDFLKQFLAGIIKKNLKVYLDTNGVLADHLQEIIELVDIISMDIKTPSSTGLCDFNKEHRLFLSRAITKEVFVKVVFIKETPIKEIEESAKIVADIDKEIPFVLQPVTPFGPIKHRPLPKQIFAFDTIAKKYLNNVFVIPQMHKVLGVK
jgi:organic radical activating enzyme